MTYLVDKPKTVLRWLMPLVLAFAAAPASASITYLLQTSNESEVLPEPIDYLSVMIEEAGDDIRFTVTTLAAFGSDPFAEGGNFGMQTFGFNIEDDFLAGLGGSLDAGNIEFLSPDPAWKVTSRNLSQFGRFDVVLSGKGNSRLDELVFLITGIDGDDLSTYAAPALQDPAAGGWFAAHVAGFTFADTPVSSAWFAGGDGNVPPSEFPPIPIPPALWLFGSGLLGLLGFARRR